MNVLAANRIFFFQQKSVIKGGEDWGRLSVNSWSKCRRSVKSKQLWQRLQIQHSVHKGLRVFEASNTVSV